MAEEKGPNEWTSLPCRKRTYERVKAEKIGGETFDELLTRLTDRH